MSLTGNTLISVENMQLNTSIFGGYKGIGTLSVQEDGITFYKVKGALLISSLFGFLGEFLSKGHTSAEPTVEYTAADIASAETKGVLTAMLIVRLKDGTELRFSSRSRLITGKGSLESAAAAINRIIEKGR